MATEGPLNLSDILTEDQIRNFSKNQLQFFLKIHQKPVSGNKPDLIQRAILFRLSPCVSDKQDEGEIDSTFSEPGLIWIGIEAATKSEIPVNFSISTITSFLSSVLTSQYQNDSEEEEDSIVDAGTKKPVVKGRLMYLSDKVNFAQFSKSPSTSNVLFRAHVEAHLGIWDLNTPRNVYQEPSHPDTCITQLLTLDCTEISTSVGQIIKPSRIVHAMTGN